ncbi:PDZK1-interacting protein 1 [Halichoeres trimaculatus]|uniref:PDZK1-interacting protein 1 n=1 Tax=Halichoeres trimaculatus TaxID=147232 RepID=UPI003D9E8C84
MEKLCAVISCLLLTVGASQAQKDPVKPLERPLPQWLMGIIAVAGFLFLTFVFFLAKKAWCDNPSSRTSTTEERVTDVVMAEENAYETTLDLVGNKERANIYYNEGFDVSEEKVTAM